MKSISNREVSSVTTGAASAILTAVLALLLMTCSTVFAQSPQFNGEKAFADLVKQCDFGPRDPGSERHHDCLVWLEAELRKSSKAVFKQSFHAKDPSTKRDYRLTNLIARFGSGGRPLLLCAHWDTRPTADHDPDPSKRKYPILGANDGASGVAVLLEMARIFAKNPPRRTVLIALWDGEDFGRSHKPEEFAIGSKYWAENPVPELPVEAILLDLVGDADLRIPIEEYSERVAGPLRARLWEIAREVGSTAFVEQSGQAVFDDHVRLHRIGIPAVNIIDFDYPYWHTMADTPDKCSAESLSQVGRVLVEFIYGE